MQLFYFFLKISREEAKFEFCKSVGKCSLPTQAKKRSIGNLSWCQRRSSNDDAGGAIGSATKHQAIEKECPVLPTGGSSRPYPHRKNNVWQRTNLHCRRKIKEQKQYDFRVIMLVQWHVKNNVSFLKTYEEQDDWVCRHNLIECP